jgi:hypothetical protein
MDGLFLGFLGVWVHIFLWGSLIDALCIFVLDRFLVHLSRPTPQTPDLALDFRILGGTLAFW